MGKYSGVVDSLPLIGNDDPSYQDEIDKIKRKLTADETHTPESLTKAYRQARFGTEELSGEELTSIALRLGKEGLKNLLGSVQQTLTALEQLLIESQENDAPGWGEFGASSNALKLRDGASLAIQYEPVGKVEDRDLFRHWCETPIDRCVVCQLLDADERHLPQICSLCFGRGEYDIRHPCSPSDETGGQSFSVEHRSCERCGGTGKESAEHPFVPGGGMERSLSLPWQTMNALTKERLLAGQDAPQGVKAYALPKIVWRGGK